MDPGWATDHRKKKRRRRENTSSTSASLVITNEVKGDIGILSHDLFGEFFGPRYISEEPVDADDRVYHVAISPWSPVVSEIDEVNWLILPVQRDKSNRDDRGPTLRCSARSSILGQFAGTLQGPLAPSKDSKSKANLEIRIIDVQPLALDQVIVTVDGDALDRHDHVQAKFGGGFIGSQSNGSGSKGKGKGKLASNDGPYGLSTHKPDNQEARLISAVKDALRASSVIHQGDMLPLPLPNHPITHVPLAPAKIIVCEPVSQGFVVSSTRIVVSRIGSAMKSNASKSSKTPRGGLGHLIADEDDDPPNELYYSAIEDDDNATHNVSDLELSTSDSESSSEDNSSSDSSDNIVSMSTPALTTIPPGVRSSLTAATPRASSRWPDGTRTPGSVYSIATATTARNGVVESGRLFTPRGLLKRIPDELLHPKPLSDEDEEARVFVDVKMLLKLGCFSGDWVKIVVSQSNKPDHWGTGTFQEDDDQIGDFRIAKIYGIQDLKPKVAGQNTTCNASSRSFSVNKPILIKPQTREAWFSPIMLANLENPQSIRLIRLSAKSQENKAGPYRSGSAIITSSMFPPVAKELTLLSVSSPLSTDKTLQNGMMAAIKEHFHYKRRILRQGDLVAVSFDITATRLLGQSPATADVDPDHERLYSIRRDHRFTGCTIIGVCWFKVVQFTAVEPNLEPGSLGVWGSAVSVEPGSTRLAEAGKARLKLPPTGSGCDYYLGAKLTPRCFPSPTPTSLWTGVPAKEYITPLRRRLRELIAASASSRAIHLRTEPAVVLLHSTQRNIGKATIAAQAAADIGVHTFTIDAYELLTEGAAGGGDVKTEAIFQARIERALSCGAAFTVILIRHIEALTADRMLSALKDAIPQCRVIIATTTEIGAVTDGMRGLFTHELEVAAPDEGERENLLRSIIESRGINLAHDVDLAGIAVKSAALVAGDLVDIVDRAIVARQDRLESLLSSNSPTNEAKSRPLIRDIIISGGSSVRCVNSSDFSLAVDAARKNFADAIGAPKIPNVSWDDVGGLTNVKDAVMETIQLPLERPELFAKGMKKRSGILFYGPPGTGKTLLAKAIATEFYLNFFSVKGPELLNMYIGESEANVRRVFQRARDARPCVVFFDELDSVAPKRGNQGDSGGVMDRIVSQLLAELDGMSDGDEGTRGGVFVIGATNRPDLLDQALLRPGRFDKMLYLGVADNHDKQLTILEALTRKFNLDPDLDLRRVADSLPFTYTGADLYALASDAMLKAITRQAGTYSEYTSCPFS